MQRSYNEEVMDHLEECGVITCIHCIGGYCDRCDQCDLYERTLMQEN
ncbi:hypothetical protein [Crassaminicella indica]|uniref:Uncharacterized protein n=1 Tax=Crassaminicella indica TaxID=2855394 RepID=A0ABX8RCB4_9CLOT|nr:hypothetical protein [Crassaminicella indica]QXM06446.1 hypothetical protein KVH43_01345 [Crassaminicella indica]